MSLKLSLPALRLDAPPRRSGACKARVRRQRFFSSTTMPATRWLAPVCSHEPASSFLDERARRSRNAGGFGPEDRLPQDTSSFNHFYLKQRDWKLLCLRRRATDFDHRCGAKHLASFASHRSITVNLDRSHPIDGVTSQLRHGARGLEGAPLQAGARPRRRISLAVGCAAR